MQHPQHPQHAVQPEPAASLSAQARPSDLPEPDDTDLAAALRNHRGSRKALAAKLGLSERTLYRRLKNL